MRFQTLLNFFNLARNKNEEPAEIIAAPQAAAPAVNFEVKLNIYATQGRKANEVILDQSDDIKFSLKPAAAQGDTAFLREAMEKRPDIAKQSNNLLLKEALTLAIVNKHPQTVAFLLDDIGIEPDVSDTEQFDQQAIHNPRWDALFVAATGMIPLNLHHAPGTVWNPNALADAKALEVFDTVLSAYTYKYRDNPQAFLNAVTKSFSLQDDKTYYVDDYKVASTASSYANTLNATRANIAPVLDSTIRSLKAKIAAEADKNRGYDTATPA